MVELNPCTFIDKVLYGEMDLTNEQRQVVATTYSSFSDRFGARSRGQPLCNLGRDRQLSVAVSIRREFWRTPGGRLILNQFAEIQFDDPIRQSEVAVVVRDDDDRLAARRGRGPRSAHP